MANGIFRIFSNHLMLLFTSFRGIATKAIVSVSNTNMDWRPHGKCPNILV